jgi:hypothetical protein
MRMNPVHSACCVVCQDVEAANSRALRAGTDRDVNSDATTTAAGSRAFATREVLDQDCEEVPRAGRRSAAAPARTAAQPEPAARAATGARAGAGGSSVSAPLGPAGGRGLVSAYSSDSDSDEDAAQAAGRNATGALAAGMVASGLLGTRPDSDSDSDSDAGASPAESALKATLDRTASSEHVVAAGTPVGSLPASTLELADFGARSQVSPTESTEQSEPTAAVAAAIQTKQPPTERQQKKTRGRSRSRSTSRSSSEHEAKKSKKKKDKKRKKDRRSSRSRSRSPKQQQQAAKSRSRSRSRSHRRKKKSNKASRERSRSRSRGREGRGHRNSKPLRRST